MAQYKCESRSLGAQGADGVIVSLRLRALELWGHWCESWGSKAGETDTLGQKLACTVLSPPFLSVWGPGD